MPQETNKTVMNDGDSAYREPQEGYKTEAPLSSLLAEASAVAGGVLESVQAVAGTTYCKGVQVNALHRVAVERHFYAAPHHRSDLINGRVARSMRWPMRLLTIRRKALYRLV